jgi:tryptophan 2,3-dioxygenase
LARRREQFAALHLVGGDLVEHDVRVKAWRWRHVQMVERQIGAKVGTGGSAGAAYLKSTLADHLYPELWDLRSVYTP